MKQKPAAIISKAILSIARHSASSTCNWLTFQPKVPEKLLSKEK
jgi:cyclic lactone autoinducer peptide